jgi:tetratricopeptide (TPR) repeat protein
MTRLLLLAAISLTAWAADTAKPPDMCAPPPGAYAPKLPARLLDGQGTIHFAITTNSPEAQKFFDQGLNQLHSFWATEAERSFLQAAALDPAAPMPWWGVAMVAAGDYRPRHQLESGRSDLASKKIDPPTQRAIDASEKATRLAAIEGAATPKEKLYIAAIAGRRDTAVADHDVAYIAGLRAILAAYPDEVEAGTFLALHLMRGYTLPDHQPRADTMEAVALLKKLSAANPNHAGVNHYIIHGWEGSDFAKDAWTACERYPTEVTNIPHALHMPGHIYAQTGKWAEAEAAFRAAAENELGYIHADALYPTGHHAHNVAFLVVAYCNEGQYLPALQAAQGLMAFGENPRQKAEFDNGYTVYRQGWFGVLRTLVTFNKWDEILDGKTLPDYPKPRERAWRHWATGLALTHRGGTAAAKAELRQMDDAIRDLNQGTSQPTPQVLEVARKELAGNIAMSAHKSRKAKSELMAAAKMEAAMRYSEPPAYPRPVVDTLAR